MKYIIEAKGFRFENGEFLKASISKIVNMNKEESIKAMSIYIYDESVLNKENLIEIVEKDFNFTEEIKGLDIDYFIEVLPTHTKFNELLNTLPARKIKGLKFIEIAGYKIGLEVEENQKKLVDNIIYHTITITNDKNKSNVFFNSYDENKEQLIKNVLENESRKGIRINCSVNSKGTKKICSFDILSIEKKV